MFAAPLGPHTLGLPILPGVTCPGGTLNPVCAAAGGLGAAGAGIAAAGAGDVLGAFTNWVVSGALWLLERIGDVLSATTSIDVQAGWFTAHFALMVTVTGMVLLPMVLFGVVQAIYRQNAGMLLRSLFVHLPLAVLLTFAALQLVAMSLKITDDLSTLVATGTGTDIGHLLDGTVTALQASAAASGLPTFVLLLGAVLLAFGAFSLWLELLVRSAAVYVAVLFLPLALASLVWPAVSHWCRRLVETLVSLILSKFVIVSILSLALGALSSGTSQPGDPGFAPVLAGGALLLLAAFSPFALLRLVPMVEAGAAQYLDGARHRVQQAVMAGPRAAMRAHALAQTLGAGSIEGGLAASGGVGSAAAGGAASAGPGESAPWAGGEPASLDEVLSDTTPPSSDTPDLTAPVTRAPGTGGGSSDGRDDPGESADEGAGELVGAGVGRSAGATGVATEPAPGRGEPPRRGADSQAQQIGAIAARHGADGSSAARAVHTVPGLPGQRVQRSVGHNDGGLPTLHFDPTDQTGPPARPPGAPGA
jgi:hypothetical protein